ncbi:TlpA family protein disulfide reductase [Corynebacterium aquatimens]|uniref:Thiol-disulfide isomerase/thioredoxin n=1 Tax=Corynebacterium aquatimens TaxID=1190508 RepID=A0A931E1C3_9CORY|nr:TlpA disulfide reductase family protein [Corynebacterium aquatimens]MBG6122438.1 thiol-disulfide isomerase/thioredoxin [Corynebacterium aquatimens]WJY65022.1 Thiol-disulfide oxidoreductase ResA [Corynebacterium aquatimens]
MRVGVNRMVAAVVCVLAAAGVLSACSSGGDADTYAFHSPGGQVEIFYEPEERAPLQGFSGESLMEPGKQVQLSDFDGKIVVLNVWGQWCAPCRAEVDDLVEVQEVLTQKGQGTVLGINVRDYNPEVSRDFVKDNGVNYPSIYDPPFKTAAALGGIPTSVIPTTIVLDAQHRPAAVFLREITTEDITDITDKLAAEAV